MIHVRRVTVRRFKQLVDVDLALPRRGTVLVHGANESGKSTLFEAVYFGLFGRPLVAESGHAALDAVIPYGASEAWVGLDVTTDGGPSLRVGRHVRRGRPNVWQLDVIGRDGEVEEVRGNAVVNARIEAELRLDGEALLNTCFVEQKKLDKLEGLSRAHREQSLMKLLNLDRLLTVGDALRVRPTERDDLARLRDRAALAAMQSELPALRARLDTVASDLERLVVLRLLDAAIADAHALARLEEARDVARARAGAVRKRAEIAESLASARRAVGEALALVDRGGEAEQEVARLAAALDDAVVARDNDVPRITSRGMALRRLQRREAWLATIEAERASLLDAVASDDARLAEIARDRESLNAVRRDLVEARAVQRDAAVDAEALAADVRAFDVIAALEEWVAAHRAAADLGGAGEAVSEAYRERQAALQRALVEAAVTAVLAALALGFSGGRPVLAIVGVGLLVFLVWRGLRAWRLDSALASRLWLLRGEAGALDRERDALLLREQAASARLAAMQVIPHSSVERAEAVLDEIGERLRDRSRGDVQEALSAAMAAQVRAREQAANLDQRQSELMVACGLADGAAIGRQRDERVARGLRIARTVARRRADQGTRAAELGVDLDVAAIEGALGALRGELAAVRRTIDTIPELERRLAERRGVAQGHWRGADLRMVEARGHVGAATARGCDLEVPALAVPPDAAGDGEPVRSVFEGEWTEVERQLAAAHEAAGGDGVRTALELAVREAAAIEERQESTATAWYRAAADVSRRAGALPGVGWALPEAPSPADLLGARDALAATVDHDAAGLESERDRVAARLNVVEHEIDRLRRTLGPTAGAIDPREAEDELARAERSMAVRVAGLEIVTQAGRNVMQHVLPGTLQYMRHLLPQLTLGRYFDAQLSDDYRIEVYDDRAGGWKKKDIFSGGTRDQFSLALRLAFALATLPEERGTAPSFLFLDEPLGAFDEERARALIHLLTAGTLADSFDQVFLVSHVRIEPSLFDYRIVLDGGRVVESNLPAAEGQSA